MTKLGNIIGTVGLILIVGGLLAPQFYPQIDKWFWLPIGLGAAAILAFLIFRVDLIKQLVGLRTVRYGTNTALYVIIFCGILVVLGAISMKHYKQIDFTETKRYSLTEQSKKILSELKQDVNIVAFYQDVGEEKSLVSDTFDMYAKASPHIKYQMVDPDRNPLMAQNYEIKTYGTIVVESGPKQEKIYSYEEDKLTNAILKVTTAGKKVVYFLKGHGEPDLENTDRDGYSSLKAALEKEQLEVKTLELFNSPGIPEDAAAVIVAAPQKTLFDPEFSDLNDYLRRGGRVLFMVEPMGPPQIDEFLTRFGIVADNAVIIDQFSRLSVGDYFMPMITNYTYHAITEGFTLASLMPIARPLSDTEDPAPGVITTPLAFTSDQAWGEMDLEKLRSGMAKFDEQEDIAGPLTVAMVATVENKEAEKEQEETPAEQTETETQKPPEGRLVVFGDAEFVNNAHLEMSGNKDLVLNSVDWLAEQESLIAVRPKEDKMQPIFLSRGQMLTVFLLPVVVVPLLSLLTGIAVVVIRRRRG